MPGTDGPFGRRCAWCQASDWQAGESAAVGDGDRNAIFHNRPPLTIDSHMFDPLIFDPLIFDVGWVTGVNGSHLPGPCFANALAAGIA